MDTLTGEVNITNLKLGVSDWKRLSAKEARINVRNRYFEQNPTNLTEGSALIRRPGLKRWLTVGAGPIRGMYSQPGSFDTCLFAASGTELYRLDDNTSTLIGTGLAGNAQLSHISMAATGNIGSTPEYLFIADGSSLYLYMDVGYGFGTLTGTPVNNDTVQIGTTYYKFTSGSVNVGTPAGTFANPWLVSLGDSTFGPFENLAYALANEATPGVNYSTLLTANPVATYQSYTTTYLVARTTDTTGSVATTETGAAISWNATFMTAGAPSFTKVQVPDDLGIISVGYIASFVICVAAPGTTYKGRFFWIQPGETIIRPLNFATAESSPDPTYSVRIVGDQIWFMGQATTEVWYPTGDANIPFSRTQGQLFDRGVWEGTDVQVKENLFLVDSTGAVFNLNGGLNRISNAGIEARIRAAMEAQIESP
jgi:hypothetical protein